MGEGEQEVLVDIKRWPADHRVTYYASNDCQAKYGMSFPTPTGRNAWQEGDPTFPAIFTSGEGPFTHVGTVTTEFWGSRNGHGSWMRLRVVPGTVSTGMSEDDSTCVLYATDGEYVLRRPLRQIPAADKCEMALPKGPMLDPTRGFVRWDHVGAPPGAWCFDEGEHISHIDKVVHASGAETIGAVRPTLVHPYRGTIRHPSSLYASTDSLDRTRPVCVAVEYFHHTNKDQQGSSPVRCYEAIDPETPASEIAPCHVDAGTPSLPWEVSGTSDIECAVQQMVSVHSVSAKVIHFRAAESGQVVITNTTPEGVANLELKYFGDEKIYGNLTDLTSPGHAVRVKVAKGESYALVLHGNTDGQTITGTVSAAVNRDPVFTEDDPIIRRVAESSAVGTAVGPAVSASDADGDTLTYTLGGKDKDSFSIDGNGQLTTNTALHYGIKATYFLTVEVNDGNGGTNSTALVVQVTQVALPGKPAAPTVTAASSSSLNVSWTAPPDPNLTISDYDVRFREGTSGSWTSHAHTGTATSATITDLKAGTAYQAQVRAINAEGTGPWSASGMGSTASDDPPPAITDVSVSYDSPVVVGDDVTVTVSVTGDAATTGDPYRWDHHGGSEWRTGSPGFTFASGKWPTRSGTRTFTVYVTGTDSVEYASEPFSITWQNEPPPQNPVITDVSVSYDSPVVVGDDVTVTVSVTGDVAASGDPYRWDHHGGSEWRTGTPGFTFASGHWPTKPGTRTFTVYVTGTDSVEYASDPFSITWQNEPPPQNPVITDVSVSYDSPAVVGDDVTVTVSVTGDAATTGDPYRWDHHGGSEWRTGSPGFTFASGHWPTTPGTRTFTVYVTGTDGVEYASDPFSIRWENEPPNEPANTAPEFGQSSYALQVDENSPAGTNVGAALTATDADSDTLTYSLSGAGLFAIDGTTGQITVNGGLDYEDGAQHSLEATVSDGRGGADTATVVVAIGDMDEPPGKPDAPTVAPASATSLNVSWTAPSNTAPAITGYSVRYRESASGSWSDHAHTGTDTAATVTGLTADTAYQVQVQATNDEGDGLWSDSGTGSTTGPYFYPTSGDQISGIVVRSGSEGCKGDDWVWSCLDEPEPDGDTSMITLALRGAVSLGFIVESGAVPGTIVGVRFEVTMAASSGVMQPSDYSFTIYAGEEELTSVSGQEAVGTDYTDVTVSAAITNELAGTLEDVSLVIQAPSTPYIKLTRVRLVVEYE